MRPPHPAWVRASRQINYYLLRGEWEMVCARAHREGRVAVVAVIDAVWLFRYREPGHCRWMHEWERRQ